MRSPSTATAKGLRWIGGRAGVTAGHGAPCRARGLHGQPQEVGGVEAGGGAPHDLNLHSPLSFLGFGFADTCEHRR